MLRIARWGIAEIGVSAVALVWGAWLVPAGTPRIIAAVVAAVCWGYVVAFFRHPTRQPQGHERCVVSAADGVVADIDEVDEPSVIGGPALRVGVFMNVFNVHVNRFPLAGTVSSRSYRPGRFLDVRHPDASHANEALALGVDIDPAVAPEARMLVRQLSGLVARRIVCLPALGDHLERGETFGMIKFGSRLEIYLPRGQATVRVTVGQRVRAGETVLAELDAPEESS